jgi:GTP diphosphokinase / guanosine-3',5'-bis(diphosphate) 3'-diphosphatase
MQIARKFASASETGSENESLFNKIISRVRKKKPTAGVLVKGVDDILIRFGKCCRPVPGDSITGYITQGHGVTVHRSNCTNALKMSTERRIDVMWDQDTTESYPVKIRISSMDRVGLLADIASSISKNGANILSVNTETREDKTVDSFFTLGVEDTGHLGKVLSDLKKVKYVQGVKRIG